MIVRLRLACCFCVMVCCRYALGAGPAAAPFWRTTLPYGQQFSYMREVRFCPQGRVITAGDGGLIALAPRTGAVLWRTTEPFSHLAVDQEGHVYAVRPARDAFAIARFTSDGRKTWEALFAGDGLAPAHTDATAHIGGVAVAGGRVFVAVSFVKDHAASRADYSILCVACDAGTGRPAWRRTLAIETHRSHFATALAASDTERLFVGGNTYVLGQSLNSAVFCLSQHTGDVLWHDHYNGTGNGADEVARRGLAPDGNGGVAVLARSDGPGGYPGAVLMRYAPDGTRLWTSRHGPPDVAASPAALAFDGGEGLYITGSLGAAFAQKTLFVAKYRTGGGPAVWSSLWLPAEGGPSGGTALAAGARTLFVAGWAGKCGFLACMQPAVLGFDLRTGTRGNVFIGEGGVAGGQQMACAFSPQGRLATAGLVYSESMFAGHADVMLFTDLDQQCFIRGDASGDMALSIADAVVMLEYLFNGGRLGCLDAADINDDGRVNITDPILVLLYLFGRGARPAPPFPACGFDPTPDLLSCTDAPPCPDAACP